MIESRTVRSPAFFACAFGVLTTLGSRLRGNDVSNVLCARVTSTAGWFDLRARKLTVPPPDLAAPLRALDRSEDFQLLPNSAHQARNHVVN